MIYDDDDIDYSTFSDEELLTLYRDVSAKQHMYDLYQYAIKILINSLYGAQGAPIFRYYNLNIAEGITMTGQVMIRYIANIVDEFMNNFLGTTGKTYIPGGDTDSIYVRCEEVVKYYLGDDYEQHYHEQEITTMLDEFCLNHIEPLLEDSYTIMQHHLNAPTNKMWMKREIISSALVYRAKKNYIARVLDDEGIRLASPKIKDVGVETVKSACPRRVRTAMIKCWDIILNGTEQELQEYVASYKPEYMSYPVDDIARPTGIGTLNKFVGKPNELGFIAPLDGATAQAKAAIAHNNALVRYGIKNIKEIKEGAKVKFIELVEGNPYYSDTFAYDDVAPEFELEKYVDRPTMYEKTFRKPVESMANTLGWTIDRKNDISSLFD